MYVCMCIYICMHIGFIMFRVFLGLGVARRSKAKAACFLSPDQTPPTT